MSDHTDLRGALAQYFSALQKLEPYSIKTLADYAEYAFEAALGGKRVGRNGKGYDLIVPRLGRVQVKSRQLPSDGRIEERLHLSTCSAGSCDFLAAIIFNADFSVKKATVVPFLAVFDFMQRHVDPQKKIRFDLIAALPGAGDVTSDVRRAVERW
ncbi:MAG TPA: hypothetical protein VFC78_02835 [Tepidisphaeraceae bacterium]|nr:hypothetical protein [Tepidisphaeraceae bacterium]